MRRRARRSWKRKTYPSNHRPLLRKPIIKENPGNRRSHCSKTGVPTCHHSSEIGAERTTAVETEPSKPKNNRSKCHKRDIVRTEVEHHFLLALTEHHTIGKGRDTGADLNRSACSSLDLLKSYGRGCARERRSEEETYLQHNQGPHT